MGITIARRFIVNYNGYSFALMVNEGLFESPQPCPLIQVTGR